MVLINGQERVLNCKYEWDKRNNNYPVLCLGIRESITWDCQVHLDQGNEGSCVGHGCAHELIAAPVEVLTVDHPYAVKIYKHAQTIDEWPGTAYEGTSVLAGVKTLQEWGWCDSYHWATTLDDILDSIDDGPFIMGTNWYKGMNNTDEDGFIHATGSNQGGHCWLLKGINFEEEYAICQNSWGTAWGNNGDFKLTFADLEKLLLNDGVASQLNGRYDHSNGEDNNVTKSFWQWIIDIIKSLFKGI